MIITYKQFNERLGINDSIDEQVEKYMKEINDNYNKNIFEFSYISNNESIPFTLKIDINIKIRGYFDKKKSVIFIRNRYDSATLLHELKHLDYSLKNIKHSKYSDSYNDIKGLVSGEKNIKNLKTNLLSLIFYYYDSDEFQAQYHSIYKEFDEFLNFGEGLDKPTRNFIKNELDKFLYQNYPSLNTILKIENFRFDDYFDKKFINNIFSLIINNDEMDFNNNSNINLIYRAIRNYYSEMYNKVFNNFSKDKLNKIKKLTKYFEKDINKKNKDYNRKIYRIVSIIYDKYN